MNQFKYTLTKGQGKKIPGRERVAGGDPGRLDEEN
jgi:hypothetical protein